MCDMDLAPLLPNHIRTRSNPDCIDMVAVLKESPRNAEVKRSDTRVRDNSEIDLLDYLWYNKTELYGGLGYVELEDVMPRKVPRDRYGEIAVVRSARVSTGNGDKTPELDDKLIRYLYNNGHTSPFEHVIFKFQIRLPIFVERQLIRHRTASVNEESHRYSVAKPEYYIPDLRVQSKSNKQGSTHDEMVTDESVQLWKEANTKVRELFDIYNRLIDDNNAREIARVILPVATMTSMKWTMNLHNLFKMLSQRMDSHAQLEIRELAFAMYQLIKPLVPAACAAFENSNPKIFDKKSDT